MHKFTWRALYTGMVTFHVLMSLTIFDSYCCMSSKDVGSASIIFISLGYNAPSIGCGVFKATFILPKPLLIFDTVP